MAWLSTCDFHNLKLIFHHAPISILCFKSFKKSYSLFPFAASWPSSMFYPLFGMFSLPFFSLVTSIFPLARTMGHPFFIILDLSHHRYVLDGPALLFFSMLWKPLASHISITLSCNEFINCLPFIHSQKRFIFTRHFVDGTLLTSGWNS